MQRPNRDVTTILNSQIMAGESDAACSWLVGPACDALLSCSMTLLISKVALLQAACMHEFSVSDQTVEICKCCILDQQSSKGQYTDMGLSVNAAIRRAVGRH